MNRFERLFGLKGEAKLRYLDGEFQVLSPGDFVRCAVQASPSRCRICATGAWSCRRPTPAPRSPSSAIARREQRTKK